MTLSVTDLSFAYSKGQEIFSGISFEVKKGQMFALLGCNGSGKSTLLNCVANQLVPDHGSISLAGQNIAAMPIDEFARAVAYVPQFHQPVFPIPFQNSSSWDARPIWERLDLLKKRIMRSPIK